jgi:hypothetical protein
MDYPEGATVRTSAGGQLRTRNAKGVWTSEDGTVVNTDYGVGDGLRSGFYDQLTLPTTHAYEPGDVLLNSSGTTFVVSKDHRAYTVSRTGLNNWIVIPDGGTSPFLDITHINDKSIVPPNPLDEAAVGSLATSNKLIRTYVRLPDGWVLATVGTNTSIRGILKSGDTGARVYETNELPSDTKLVK